VRAGGRERHPVRLVGPYALGRANNQAQTFSVDEAVAGASIL
jgi:hypothetical protein